MEKQYIIQHISLTISQINPFPKIRLLCRIFYLKKNNLNKDGEAPIMARITIDGTIAQFSCKASIRPDLWETKYNHKGMALIELARPLSPTLNYISQPFPS